jgi:hypothetical protein
MTEASREQVCLKTATIARPRRGGRRGFLQDRPAPSDCRTREAGSDFAVLSWLAPHVVRLATLIAFFICPTTRSRFAGSSDLYVAEPVAWALATCSESQANFTSKSS